MKKSPSSLPVPVKYGFDDTPKAFKRMLQRKEAMGTGGEYKKVRTDGPAVSRSQTTTTPNPLKRAASSSSDSQRPSDLKHSKHSNPSNPQQSAKISTSTTATLSAGFKTLRSKRKTHLQSRDIKKKLKRFDAQAENFVAPSALARDVRDVVQEPPKLHEPKKAFKKIQEERGKLRSWSDLEDDDLEAHE